MGRLEVKSKVRRAVDQVKRHWNQFNNKSKVRRAVDQVKRHWNQFNNKKVVPESSIPPSKHRYHLHPIKTGLMGLTESRTVQKKKDSIAATARKSSAAKPKARKKTVSKTRKTKSSK
jgi:hypothetical protein